MRRRDVLSTAVDRLVGAAEQLGAVPVDVGDVRALAAIVGAQARVVEALAKLDAAQDRRRTGRVQRDLLRARLASLPGMARDSRGMVVYLPREDDLSALTDEELHQRIERLAASIREDDVRAVAELGAGRDAVALDGLRLLLARAAQGDTEACAALAPLVHAARPVVVLPELEVAE